MEQHFGSSPTRERLTVAWLHPIGMLGLSVYNFVMRILTLGVYHFWGKTEVRRRIWSSIRLNGEPLEYTGTGRELFLGFLVIFGLVLLPILLLTFAAAFLLGPDSWVFKLFQLALYAGVLLLTGIAIYRAQRFRLSRTRWRGIRAGLDGSSWTYGWTYFWTLLTLPLTLGWSAPWRSTKLQRIITDDMRFGTERFRFSGSSRPLYKPFALYWFLMGLVVFVTLAVVGGRAVQLATMFEARDGEGNPLPPDATDTADIVAFVLLIYGALFVAGLLYVVLSAWYRSAMMRHFARYTHLGAVGFESSVTARGLLWIAVTNYLILLLGATVVTAIVGGLGYSVLTMFAGQTSEVGDLPQHQALMQSTIGLTMGFVFLISLGMLAPITQARTSGYLIRNLHLSGDLDMAAVAAGAEPTSKRGEGLAQAFDIDAI
ncbi:MAG: YjgN family protein [Hyphomicrobiaceae bacterium]